ncbi:MAG: hypothetical protein JRJ87_19370 [Deltaproteobacteria bacterium]|nr:hypothetical protein [Deltaproteobacteria bacterium]
MTDSTIDKDKLQRPQEGAKPSADSHIKEVDDVIIQVTQVFCHNGHNLLINTDELFDGAPGISLLVSDGTSSGEVILSPFHGDHRRFGKTNFAAGTEITVSCPVCKEELKQLSSCSCEDKGKLLKLYLNSELNEANLVGLCNIWGCHRSKVIDQAELLSAYIQD